MGGKAGKLSPKEKAFALALCAIHTKMMLLGMLGPSHKRKIIPKVNLERYGRALKCLSYSDDSYAKTAACYLLDYYDPLWRDKNPKEAGFIAKREDPVTINWRKSVLQRDNYTCQECESKEKVEAHHILRWSFFPHARVLKENGISLCHRCHVKKHSKNYLQSLSDTYLMP